MTIVCPLCLLDNVVLLGKRSDFFSLNGYAAFLPDIHEFDRHIYRCDICGLQFSHPSYTPEDLGKLYNCSGYVEFTKIVQDDTHWTQTEEHIQSWVQDLNALGVSDWKRSFVQKLKGQDTKPRMLDIGCGNGRYLLTFSRLGFDVTGIDLSDDHIQDVRKRGFKAEKASWEEFEPPEKFDCIAAIHIIEHVVDPHLFMDKIKAMLAPGGIIIIETPFAEDSGEFEQRYRDVYHTMFFDHFTLSILADWHGFEPSRFHHTILNSGGYHYYFKALLTAAPPSTPEPNVVGSKTGLRNLRRAYDQAYHGFLDRCHENFMLRENIVILTLEFYKQHGFAATLRKIFNVLVYRAKNF
ncbi:MAG: class I SAM-dependent methyltransferase [Deltaproteobacteria bacterium]|nr:class I SAM-dependent methyltransferase [Deltaproteobacteria bacterium]